MIREFAKDDQLIAFFEAEPKVLDSGVPWLYNTLDFKTIRNGLEVRCRLVLSYGEITTQLLMDGKELAKYELRDAETVRIVTNEHQEVLGRHSRRSSISIILPCS